MSHMNRVNVFLLGATGRSSDITYLWASELTASARTGYIGGSVLGRLLSSSNPSFDLTVLVRDAAKANKLEQFGVKTVLGKLDDAEKIQTLASQADIVLECVRFHRIGSDSRVLRKSDRLSTRRMQIISTRRKLSSPV